MEEEGVRIVRGIEWRGEERMDNVMGIWGRGGGSGYCEGYMVERRREWLL